jgi:hypothetical protein
VIFGGAEFTITGFGLDYGFELLLRSLDAKFAFKSLQTLLVQTTEGIDFCLQNHVNFRDLLKDFFFLHESL